MNDAEKELQQKIEGKLPAGTSADAIAYQRVFDVLAQEPYEPYELPLNFADKVLQRIEVDEKSLAKDNLWLNLGLAFIFMSGIITAIVLNIDFRAFKFISGYAGLFVLCAALLIGFQWIDKTVVRKKLLTDLR